MEKHTLEEKLKARHVQPTAMRLLVMDFLRGSEIAVGLPELEEQFPRSDRTTLYRTLKTFEEHGLVHQIHDETGSAKYALCAEDCTCSYPDDIHVHFYCTTCHQTYCFQQLKVPDIMLPEKFSPSSGSFVINGRCPSCGT